MISNALDKAVQKNSVKYSKLLAASFPRGLIMQLGIGGLLPSFQRIASE